MTELMSWKENILIKLAIHMNVELNVYAICKGGTKYMQWLSRFTTKIYEVFDIVVVPDGKNDHEVYFKGMSNASAVN